MVHPLVRQRLALVGRVLESKAQRGLTWNGLAAGVGNPGRSRIQVTAALLGNGRLEAKEAERAVSILGLSESHDTALLQQPAYRGPSPMGEGGPTGAATDPFLYRLQEALWVYGPALKELVSEEFGDGIMSAIDFHCTLEKETADGTVVPSALASAEVRGAPAEGAVGQGQGSCGQGPATLQPGDRVRITLSGKWLPYRQF